MTEIKNILVIGCGGIGSYLIRELDRLLKNGQLGEVDVTICDMDKVEPKNVKYQNFTIEDVNGNKAKVLGTRYLFNYSNKQITEFSQLKDYDLFLICVDNAKTRKLIFEYCFENDKYFIDLRAESRAVAVFTKDRSDLDTLIKSLGDSDKSTSCQLAYELESDTIQNGNIIVASIGSQLLLNKLRGEENKDKYIFYF